MEFFATAACALTPEQLRQTITGPRLAEHCASIDRVLHWHDEQGLIYCLWGQFSVNRELISDGIRFTLPSCPNALAWTLTADIGGNGTRCVLVHCTINRSDHEADFIESIQAFVEDWRNGLERLT